MLRRFIIPVVLLLVVLGASLVTYVIATAETIAKFEFDIQRNIVYATFDNHDLLLDAYVPKGDGPFPGVLVVHGGSWKEGDRNQLASYAKELAELGFVCFAIDYRLAPQYLFPAQIEDCRTAVHWIRTHADDYNVNPQKLGAAGYSAGGHLVSLLATTGEVPGPENGNIDTRLQAVVAGGAPTDFRDFPKDNGAWAVYWMGGDLDSVPEKFEQASSIAFVDKDDSPVFFFHGTGDSVVPIEWALPCCDALKKAGVRTHMHRVDGARHMQAIKDPEALKKAWAFLCDELQAAEPAP